MPYFSSPDLKGFNRFFWSRCGIISKICPITKGMMLNTWQMNMKWKMLMMTWTKNFVLRRWAQTLMLMNMTTQITK
uniref:Uncharacterized protein n=1 Tax=Salix viminalis TaxID=40686 RepID=A0A6N2KZ77_SALVM